MNEETARHLIAAGYHLTCAALAEHPDLEPPSPDGLVQSIQKKKVNPPVKSVIEFAVRAGLTAEDGVWFRDKYKATGWMNGAGVQITNWRAQLMTLRKAGAFPSQGGKGSAPCRGVMNWEQAQALRQQIVRLKDDATFLPPGPDRDAKLSLVKTIQARLDAHNGLSGPKEEGSAP
jgi:hypothetical protein